MLQGVRLVDDQHRGALQSLDAVHQLPFRLPDVGNGLHQQHNRIHIGHRLPHHVDHIISQAGTGLVEARGIHKDKLTLPPGEYAADAVAGGLRLIGDDGHLLPHQGIDQGGFSHIGAAAEGNNSRFFNGHRDDPQLSLSIFMLWPFGHGLCNRQPSSASRVMPSSPRIASSRARIWRFMGPSSRWS